MKKEWRTAILAAVIVLLLMMNTYGQQELAMSLTAEYAAGEELISYAPHLTLPEGEYTLRLSGFGSVEVRSGDGRLLGAGDAGESLSVRLEQDESEVILYGESGGGLSALTVSRSFGGAIYRDWLLLSLLIGALVLVMPAVCRREGRKTEAVIFCTLLGVTVLVSYPLFGGTVGFGHDLNFHLYRIEGIKDGLLEGQFPVRLHPTHNNGYGYITASVYPELFLYFPAMLRLLGASPVMAYNIFLFAVNGMTAGIMYYSAKGVTGSRYAGVLASVIYTLSTWRCINLYYRAAVGEALAMVFFPLFLYGLYLLLAGDGRKWWVLALGCTGIFQSHIISTVFAALTALVMAVIYHKNLAQKQRLMGAVKAVALTVGLNLWYLAAFATYYLGADLAIKHTPENTEFYQNAVFPTELFNLFNTEFGYSQLLEYGIRGNMSLSLGVGVAICLVIGVAFCLRGKKEKDERQRFYRALIGLGLALLFMSTTLFPWQLLQQNRIINAFCGTVRMPWRFLSLASPAFCMAAAGILALRKGQERTYTTWGILGVCSLAFILWGTAYTTELDPALKVGRAVSTYTSAGYDNEYYLQGTDPGQLTAGRYLTGGSAEVTGYQKRGTHISLQLQNVRAGDWVEVPLLYYSGYEARDGQGHRLEAADGDNHVVRILLQEGTEQVELQYRGCWYFRAAELITVLTLGAFGVWWWRKGR